MLATTMHLMQGTPYVFQGQEIGMTNCPFKPEEYEDVVVKNIVNMFDKMPIIRGIMKKIVYKIMDKRGRDHSRTPVQWDNKKNAGFTDGEKTWIKVNPNYVDINIEAAIANPNSILNYYKKLIKFRIGNEIIKEGTFKDLSPKSKAIYAYERNLGEDSIVVISNFSNKEIKYDIASLVNYSDSKVELSNYERDDKLASTLYAPYETVVYKIKK